ncbi:hypothetical protein chiPu_0009771 [Chiloscyllium punctatum]|uniref:Uncharacterized protein n=1 Tax=Chiloscyllium punctatum TaxID=137246 RepID=A0A401SLP6_CHIPU|nr:hypothetical protein [Chiloscyllium punctatum]
MSMRTLLRCFPTVSCLHLSDLWEEEEEGSWRFVERHRDREGEPLLWRIRDFVFLNSLNRLAFPRCETDPKPDPEKDRRRIVGFHPW